MVILLCGILDLTLNVSVRHIPEWLPWFSYKPLARIGHNLGQEVLYEPIRFVKESIVSYQLFERNGISTRLIKLAAAQWHSTTFACA